MTKSEIVSRIIDRITDPWSENPEDYLYTDQINLISAKEWLHAWREEDKLCELDPDECMPKEATPELLMEAYNCYIRYQKTELRVKRLAEYITDNEMVCEYDNYFAPTLDNPIDIIPVDFLYNTTRFPFSTHNTENPDIIDMLHIGMNSAKTFNNNHEFCWFDKDNEVLHSTDTPFADGVLDAEAFARFVISDAEALEYFIDDMDDDEIRHIFGCERKDVLKEVNK